MLTVMNSKGEAFRTDKWHSQMRMMDAMITALDRAMVGFTYVACPGCPSLDLTVPQIVEL